MGILSDLANAVEAYPHEYLDLQIVQVDPPGTTPNTHEDVRFRIQVTNTGPLDVENLTVLVEGLHGTMVAQNLPGPVWESSFTTISTLFGRIPGHSGDQPAVSLGDTLHFKPTRAFGTPQELVRVSVAGWTADADHVWNAHSRADAEAEATYSAVVSPA